MARVLKPGTILVTTVKNHIFPISEMTCMSSLSALGIIGTGGLGVLVAALFLDKLLNTGLGVLLGIALVVFVLAGAIALVARSW